MKTILSVISVSFLVLTGLVHAHPDHKQAIELIESQAPAAEIKPLLEQAAADGHAPAMAYLGWWYETGQGDQQNAGKAADWYAAAAEHGALEYAIKLGWMYLQGEALPRDRAQAETWFVYAQERDYLPANVALGSVLIADALGGESQAAVRARDLLVPAFIQGDVHAAYFLARLYREGIGDIEPSVQRSFAYSLFGAMHGQAQMQGWLAEAYSQGKGAHESQKTAAAWALLAVEGSDQQAERLIEQIDVSFTDQQWVEAWVEANRLKQQISAVLAECCG